MHPEVEDKIRDYARNFLITSSTNSDPYFKAAEARYISFDDLYFLGIFNGAGCVALGDLVDTDPHLPTLEHEEFQVSFVVQDDSGFRYRESERTCRLVAQLYDCTPDEAGARFENIQVSVARYSNEQIQRK